MELLFVGTGVSTAIPVMGHLSTGCACYDAINTPHSKNLRNNVSIMLRKPPSVEQLKAIGDPPTNSLHNSRWQKQRAEAECNIMFDCGKTFRAAYFNVLAKLGISVISAVLLTHEHADAVAGLDDLRDLIPIENTGVSLEVYQALKPCPTYMTQFTLKTLVRTVGYILRYSRFLNEIPKSPQEGKITDPSTEYTFGKVPSTKEEYDALIASTPVLGTVDRRVTSLDIIIIPETVQQFYVEGLAFPMYSFPVFHGGDYICTAYAFGSGLKVKSEATEIQRSAEAKINPSTPFFDRTHRSIVYLSDVSKIGPESLSFLRSLEPVDLLIVDFLLGPGESHFSHWCFDDVVAFTQILQPRAVLGVGMWCTIEHNKMNAMLSTKLQELKTINPRLRTDYMGLAYDGLTLKIE